MPFWNLFLLSIGYLSYFHYQNNIRDYYYFTELRGIHLQSNYLFVVLHNLSGSFGFVFSFILV